MNFRTVENVVLGLYSPTLVGRTRAERSYQDFMNAYANAEEAAPPGLVRVRRKRQRMEEELARLKGEKKKFQLDVLLLTQTRRSGAGTRSRTTGRSLAKKRRRG